MGLEKFAWENGTGRIRREANSRNKGEEARRKIREAAILSKYGLFYVDIDRR
jgi:hypothetical protein